MTAIKATEVKELREKTGVGMMECKQALVENNGDMEKAILWLRERGMSRAAKKAGRVAAEGIVSVLVSADRKQGVILEVNCETDFAGKNEDFQEFVKTATAVALKNQVASIEQLAETKMNESTVAGCLTNLIAKVGENMNLRRVSLITVKDGLVAAYSHMGGKIGAIIGISGGSDEKVNAVGMDVAMHIAAAAPKYLNRDTVSTVELDQERELGRKKLIEEGKAENMIDKILAGQMNKFYGEICLIDQPFVKDPKLTVLKYVKSVSPALDISTFYRFQLGEGIEKKEENFAEEVAAQLKK
jgi:elongation factor Ts